MDWDVFWSVLVVMFIFIPLLMIWGFAVVDLFTRPDLGGFSKVLWLFGILFLPVLGTILYFLTRPAYPMPRKSESDIMMDNLTRLNVMHDTGQLTDDEYQRQRERLLMAS
jgi:hypothetical protein